MPVVGSGSGHCHYILSPENTNPLITDTMKKTELFNSREQYVAPCCNVFTVESEGVLCASDWGDEDGAGSGLFENPDYQYNF